MRRTFVIGDVHGHIDRLKALLTKAGFDIEAGDSSRFENSPDIVQVGDLGHYGYETAVGDRECWEFVNTLPHFHVLWGNHDMALFNPNHRFRGQAPPLPGVLNLIACKRPLFALARHGYLITHAGLHPSFYLEEAFGAQATAAFINLMCTGKDYVPVRDALTRYRGGNAPAGGILWRDDREELADLQQVYGHTRGNIRKHDWSYCIDTADRDNGSLAGIWLPEMKVVAVGPDADIHETPFPDEV